MANQLIHENSPYLLQHADNPVEWYPWGEEALQKARAENKPIFLSVGYAACHWCHVMAHESFEDPATAAIMNRYFINIKVDREERPDIDSIYMNAVVALTGQGGWPMSVFLTPEGEPFYGGTYFPPTRRYGMPSFHEVLEAVARAWQNNSADLRQTGRELTQRLAEPPLTGATAAHSLRPSALDQATRTLLNSYDWKQGGWGKAPRFPQPMAVEFLLMQAARPQASLREEALMAAAHALNAMSRGGMYDVVGGGFARYSTDDDWLVPHFEKMLYDNGQLALAYLHAAQITGNLSFRQTCQETLDFIARELTHPAGGFYSSLDADSEGEEGRFYVWSLDELRQALGGSDSEDYRFFERVYTVSKSGNFEDHNILQRKDHLDALARALEMPEANLIARLSAIHARLYAARAGRTRPSTDDKVLVSWNALALRAFAEAARALDRADYLAVARKNAAFLLDEMYHNGRLLRSWRSGQARHNAYLEDYAGLILALLALYQSDPNPRWFQSARTLAEEMVASFRDPQDGGFFDTRTDHESLITRPKDWQDNATPSGNALAASALLQLAAFDERPDWRRLAEEMLAARQDILVQHPTAFGQWLQALDFAIGPVLQIALVGPLDATEMQAYRAYLGSAYRPRVVIAAVPYPPPPGSPSLLHDRPMLQGRPTAYVCQGFTCNLPVNDLEGLKQQVKS